MSGDESDLDGLSCVQVLAALGDYLDGALDDDTKVRLEAHVATCSNCERFGGVYTQIVRAIRAHGMAEGEDPEVWVRLHRRLEST